MEGNKHQNWKERKRERIIRILKPKLSKKNEMHWWRDRGTHRWTAWDKAKENADSRI